LMLAIQMVEYVASCLANQLNLAGSHLDYSDFYSNI
jgi:hypothetical protein